MQDTDNFDSKQWLKVYIDEQEWHHTIEQKLAEVIEYTMQEIERMRGDYNLLIILLLLNDRGRENQMQEMRKIANRNIQKMQDPEFIAKVQKGKASMGDIFERKAPKGSVEL